MPAEHADSGLELGNVNHVFDIRIERLQRVAFGLRCPVTFIVDAGCVTSASMVCLYSSDLGAGDI